MDIDYSLIETPQTENDNSKQFQLSALNQVKSEKIKKINIITSSLYLQIDTSTLEEARLRSEVRQAGNG